MKLYVCSICKKSFSKISDLKKIRELRYCKDCYKKNRQERREETIEQSEDREKILELEKQINRESYIKYIKKNRISKNIEEYAPKIKNTTDLTNNNKNNNFNYYLTFQEKQYLFGQLIKKGFSEEDAKIRLDRLIKHQNNLKLKLLKNNISAEAIKSLQTKLIEDLFQ